MAESDWASTSSDGDTTKVAGVRPGMRARPSGARSDSRPSSSIVAKSAASAAEMASASLRELVAMKTWRSMPPPSPIASIEVVVAGGGDDAGGDDGGEGKPSGGGGDGGVIDGGGGDVIDGGGGDGGGGDASRLLLPEQTAPAPSVVPQFSLPQVLAGQSDSRASDPVHRTSSSQNESATVIRVGAEEAREAKPSCRQTTLASAVPQTSSQTYRHSPE